MATVFLSAFMMASVWLGLAGRCIALRIWAQQAYVSCSLPYDSVMTVPVTDYRISSALPSRISAQNLIITPPKKNLL
jgi:hypothetical protein